MVYSPPLPLMYKEGDASTVHDIEFEGMTLIGLLKKLKGACQFPVKGVQTQIEDDDASDVGEMEDISGYGVSDFVGEDDVYVIDGVIYPEFDPSLPWNEMKPILGLRRNHYKTLMVLCGRDIAEGRCGGKKGVQSQSPGKKSKGVQSQSPSKKGKGKCTKRKVYRMVVHLGFGHLGCKMEAVFRSKP
nr:hypothetical protein [Tanacetum cinerariifolium]